MRYAVFTASTPEYTPEEAVRAVAEAGYDGIEWRVLDEETGYDGPPSFWEGNRATIPFSSFLDEAPRIKALCDTAGLAMPSVGTYVTCEDLDAVDVAMRGASMLGAPQLRVHAAFYDPAENYLRARDRARDQYAGVADLARQHGVRALVEIHQGTVTPSASAAAWFVRDFDPAHVGVIHDMGNMVIEGWEQYRMSLDVLGPHLAHVHVKNTAWSSFDDDGVVRWKKAFVPLREGRVDLDEFCEYLNVVGYDAWISFEDFSTTSPVDERLRYNPAETRAALARGKKPATT